MNTKCSIIHETKSARSRIPSAVDVSGIDNSFSIASLLRYPTLDCGGHFTFTSSIFCHSNILAGYLGIRNLTKACIAANRCFCVAGEAPQLSFSQVIKSKTKSSLRSSRENFSSVMPLTSLEKENNLPKVQV